MAKIAQDWDKSVAIGDEAVAIIKDFLFSEAAAKYWIAIESIESVENHRASRRLGFDLLCKIKNAIKPMTRIEAKGDTYHYTGNLFFETKSNIEFDTPGCFVNSAADWFLYCFVEVKLIYVLPLAEVKDWFESNLDSFKEKTPRTSRKSDYGTSRWATLGRLVPRDRLEKEVPMVMKFQFKKGEWVWDMPR